MALFKIEKGLAASLATARPTTNEGWCYFTTDDGKFYIDIATGSDLTQRVCLNACAADRLTVNAGDVDTPVYFANGVPVACTSLDLNAASATKLTSSAGSSTQPIYFSNGKPTACGSSLAVSITGSAASCTGNAASANKLTVNAGNASTPIYFANGVPVVCTNLNANGYLPLEAGENNKLTGPLGLTENVMYSTALPESGFNGQLFFLEDDSPALPTGGTAGQVLVKNSSVDGDASWKTNISGSAASAASCTGNAATATKLATAQTISLTGDVTGSASFTGNTACSITATVANNSHTHTWSNISDRSSCTISTSGTITGSAVYGAVYNDYAEYRSQMENIKPGYCVASADNGRVYKTTEKFQACDGIVSDTFGFAIGETDECKTPLAVAGRVLAYCEGNRYDYHSGDTVCAGPDGKVCKMTREEIREWPDRIVGIVSEIPEYEIWGTGNTKVNGRIWIKVK